MKNHALAFVILCSACTTTSLAPDQPAAAMLGDWSYTSPRIMRDAPDLNTGLRVQIRIDSAAGARFWGRVTLWFAGDVGAPLGEFGRVHGQIDEANGVSLEVPRASGTIVVAGRLEGDVLTVDRCSSDGAAAPFAAGTRFERTTTL